MTRHLALTGMMGSGKTTVGDLVAARLGRPFVDTDVNVEAAAGRSVEAIFAADGEDAFRALEHEAIVAACDGPPAVLALGGGAVTRPDNVRVLRASAFTVLLEVPVAALAQRVGDGSGRPLVGTEVETDLVRLAEQRAEAYHAAADAVIDVDGVPAEVAMAVLAVAARADGVLTDDERAELS